LNWDETQQIVCSMETIREVVIVKRKNHLWWFESVEPYNIPSRVRKLDGVGRGKTPVGPDRYHLGG